MEAIMLRALALAALAIVVAPAVSAQEPPRSDGWVVISVDEYRTLRLRAYPPEPPPEPPPIEMALTRVDYDLRVNGGSVEGEARLAVDVFAEGLVVVPLPSNFFVRAARGARLMSIVGQDGQQLLLSKRGRSVIDLDVVAPLNVSGGSESITVRPAEMLRASPGNAQPAVCRVGLVVPRPDIDLSVDGGVLTERPADVESPWVAYATTSKALTLTWTRRVEQTRSALPPRIRGHVVETVGLAEETGLVTANVRVDVTQGVLPAIALALPDGLIVNQVSGSIVGDWDFKPGSLRVAFLEPLATQTALSIAAEMPVSREGVIAVPLVRLTDAERETGGVAVEVLGAGEMTERQPRGLDPADPSDLGEGLASRATPSMIAFRYRPQAGTAPRNLNVNVLRYTPQAVLVANIEEARYDALLSEEGKILVRARYAVRNNQRAFLAIKLPTGATLWSAVVASRPLRPGAATDGGLLVPLVKGSSGQDAPPFVVEVSYVQRNDAWKDQGRTALALPSLDLPVSRTGIVLHYSPRFRVKPEPGAFRLETDGGPFTDALRQEQVTSSISLQGAGEGTAQGMRGGVVGGVVGGLPAARTAAPEELAASRTDKLIGEFRRQSAGRPVAGVIPVRVRFPEFGRTLYVVSELTAEGQVPSLEMTYKREGRW
jgi:hypothetical protein